MEAKGEDIDNVTLTIDDNEDLFSSENEEDGVVAKIMAAHYHSLITLTMNLDLIFLKQ